ncbi:MAG: glycosyltransferase family 2 protein [Lentisphaerae bacterium]|nr:glycosyltransferase family 2 protein [Lentisphaerota bacterium]
MLTIIIISYNSAHVLIENFADLIDSNRYKTIIVDNASSDGSPDLLRNRFPSTTIKFLKNNIGYGRAANIGLHAADTPYALLLNPDLSVSSKQIEKLLNYARKDEKGALWGPASNSRDFTQGKPKSVDWISGCAMLFEMSKLKQIGFFDENIFLFFEETDLCKRVLESGFEIKLCQDVYFDHKVGQACKLNPEVEWLKSWHYGWSRCYFFSKHDPKNLKRTPSKQYAQYRWKALISISQRKRRKYSAQAAGANAFLRGELAFLPNGNPQSKI